MEMHESRLTITVQEAARLLGISRGLAYAMTKTGELPVIRFGRRLLVPRRALERMLEECGGKVNSAQKNEKGGLKWSRVKEGGNHRVAKDTKRRTLQ